MNDKFSTISIAGAFDFFESLTKKYGINEDEIESLNKIKLLIGFLHWGTMMSCGETPKWVGDIPHE